MKKNLYKAILAAGIVFLLAGCAKSDHLDTVPSYEYSSENVWKSADLAKAAVTGIYSMLYTLWIQVGAGNHATDTWASVMDPVNNWLGWNIILDGNLRPSNGNVVSMYWGPLYEVVRRSNDVIFHIDQVPDDQLSAAERAELKCEALFFRAYAYYYLATMWGDVPLITTEMTEDELLQISRSPQKTVYEQCVADLTECVNNPTLPGRTTNGRVSKGAAYAYRGFVYQFLGDSQKALSDYEAIGNLGFALFSPHDGAPGNRDFHDLLLPENEHCPEFIFAVECYPISGMGNDRARSHYGNRDTGASGWDGYYPNPGYVELFENADGSLFDWEDYCPGWNSLTDNERSVFFFRDGLIDGSNGKYGNSDATAFNPSRYENMKAYCGEQAMNKYYLDSGNEARLRKAYENRDPRLEQAIITPYSVYEGYVAGIGTKPWVLRWPYIIDTVEPYDLRTDSPYMFCYLWRKYVPERDEWTVAWTYPANLSLVRYAEILLRRAECLNELGRTDEAATYVNMVRKRAGHVLLNDPHFPATKIAGQDDMRRRIRNEFYVELGGEESMYFLELRWGIWYDKRFRAQNNGLGNGVNGTYKDAPIGTGGLQQCWGTNYGYCVPIGEHSRFWPIPAREREMNPNLTQNPGYSD